jgi:hypothetical protein
MNNSSDNKGQIGVQGPSTTTCTLLTNHIVTPPPNLSTPNKNSMVMSKLISFKLKEKLRINKKLLYNVICHISNKESMHFDLSLF